MQQPQPFSPHDHIVQLKSRDGSKDYLPVQWRLVWFRERCPDGTIETEMLHFDPDRETQEEVYVWNNDKHRSEKVVKRANGFVIFRAVVRDGKGGVATGTKSEKAASFADFIEKAETGAIGRALAALGYGTQFAPELDEEHRIVDAPVERATPTRDGGNQASAQDRANKNNRFESSADAVITGQQLASIRKLCEHLGKAEPDNLASTSYLDAKKLIQQLTAEYKEQKESGKAAASQPAEAQATPENASQQATEQQPTALYLTPDEVADIKKRWAEICHIKPQGIEQRWKGFKAYVHPPLAGERVMDDEHITAKDRTKMEQYLTDQQKTATAEK